MMPSYLDRLPLVSCQLYNLQRVNIDSLPFLSNTWLTHLSVLWVLDDGPVAVVLLAISFVLGSVWEDRVH